MSPSELDDWAVIISSGHLYRLRIKCALEDSEVCVPRSIA